VRLRPVLMTALAMVIGGLLFATVSTLFFVPVVFSVIHRRFAAKRAPEAHLGATYAPA
jgi:multidrug efflux pump subunit AcrB